MSSDIHASLKQLKVYIKLIDNHGVQQSISVSNPDFQVTEGDLTWEFHFDCVRKLWLTF